MADKSEKKESRPQAQASGGESVQNLLAQFQQAQQQLQAVMMQKESARMQIAEHQRAEEELAKLKDDAEVFRATGTILIKSTVPALKASLKDEKTTLANITSALERQEKALKEKLTSLQTKVKAALSSQGRGVVDLGG